MSTCHNGPKLVIDHQGLQIYGASEPEAIANAYDFDLIISMTSVMFKTSGIRENSCRLRSEGLKRLIEQTPEVLSLDWPDMGVPSLGREFWVELVKVLKKKGNDRARFKNNYKVMVHCMGGHGRTGTALALLLHFIKGEEGDLVKIVREIFCSKCVETAGQIKYIEKLTGVKIEASIGSKDYHSNSKDDWNKRSSSIKNHIEYSTELGTCLLLDVKNHGVDHKHKWTKECKSWLSDADYHKNYTFANANTSSPINSVTIKKDEVEYGYCVNHNHTHNLHKQLDDCVSFRAMATKKQKSIWEGGKDKRVK